MSEERCVHLAVADVHPPRCAKCGVVVCPDCGGDCAPECGRHPMGCMYGGFSAGYWIAVEGCPLEHGEDLVVAENASGTK